jgi:carbonic anhydrase
MLNESARRALDALFEGNRRFREGAAVHPRRDSARRAETALGQKPFAAIVACADSRVPPEIIFDQGIGDVFVVRTAGNVLDAIGLGSLEYAVVHLDVPLIVVLGHTHCGAIEAALSGGEASGNARAVIEALTPALEQSRGAPGDPVDAAVRANVARTAALIARSQRLIGRPSARGSAAVIGALYNIETGAVELLA